jgi:hypothetical protein
MIDMTKKKKRKEAEEEEEEEEKDRQTKKSVEGRGDTGTWCCNLTAR